MLLLGVRKFPLPPKQRTLLLQNYGRKASPSGTTKKPRVPKKQTNKSGQNVLMEYDSYYNNPKSNIGLTTIEDEHETGLSQQMELPKELVLDQRSIEKQIAKNLQGIIVFLIRLAIAFFFVFLLIIFRKICRRLITFKV